MTKKRKTQLITRLSIFERVFNQQAYESEREAKQNFEEAYNALEQFLHLCQRHQWTCVATCPEEQYRILCRLKRLFPEVYGNMTEEELWKHSAASVVKRILSGSEALWVNRDTRTCSFEVLAGLAYSVRYVQVGEV